MSGRIEQLQEADDREQERLFHLHESRHLNDCIVWAALLTGKEEPDASMYLLSPGEIAGWIWEEMFREAHSRA